MRKPAYLSGHGQVKVAAVVPKLKVADPTYNIIEISDMAHTAIEAGARIIVFPELSITGYTAGDLFKQRLLQENAISFLASLTHLFNKKSLIFVGLPLVIDSMLFNVAAAIYNGRVIGIIPKTYLPGDKEFYEERVFSCAHDLKSTEIDLFGDGKMVPIGTDLLFTTQFPGCIICAEICEDVWTMIPPSSEACLAGATIAVNLSASNDLVGKAAYRRTLITGQSGRAICGYVYTSCGVHESTSDMVFGGHALIGENGNLLAESKRFERNGSITYADIDYHDLVHDRTRTPSFAESIRNEVRRTFRKIRVILEETEVRFAERKIAKSPFVPLDPSVRKEVCDEIFNIQVSGLAGRLEQTKIQILVLGLSGGLDSTHELLVAVEAYKVLGRPLDNIHCLTMPGFGTTKRTEANAIALAEALGVTLVRIPICESTTSLLKDIQHDSITQDIAYENAQARTRTLILMTYANKDEIKGMVLGTGDLSEIALGWCTFTADNMSHYNPNCSIPKTLIKYLVLYVADEKSDEKAKAILLDILDTPISPELTKAVDGKEIDQITEDKVGPYVLNDFFLYRFVRWGAEPLKILWIAERAFEGVYDEETILKWLRLFIKRFFGNQWKRSNVPGEGPKVGSVSLSSRGDWRMPSDAQARLWLEQLD